MRESPRTAREAPAGRCARSPQGTAQRECAPRQWQPPPPRAGQTRPTAEPAGTAPECPGPAPGCTPRLRPRAHALLRPSRPARQRPPGPAGPQRAARPAKGTAPALQCPRPAQHSRREQPGLDLISRRPPKQKFANFEDYLAAHGGDLPLPLRHRTQRTPETAPACRGCRMTPATAAALRCPRMRRAAAADRPQPALCQCPQLDLAKEGYAYLLPMQKNTPPTPATARPWSAPAARSCRPGTTPR